MNTAVTKINVAIPGAEKAKSYPVIIGNSLLDKLSSHLELSHKSSIVIVVEETLPKHHLSSLLVAYPEASVVEIACQESDKNLSTVEQIWHKFQASNLDRRGVVLNLGGGCLGDLAGFAASTYMRGVSFIQLPTTLLSQVDASVGGKTGINFGSIKNLVGAFQQPEAVCIDTSTLSTLSKRTLCSGFAEMIKHALIADKNHFMELESSLPLVTPENVGSLDALIATSCRIKSCIVGQDEKENGPRKLLNAGHTVGHAVESIALSSGISLLHGEAVSIGLAIEAKISQKLGRISQEEYKRITELLRSVKLPVGIELNCPIEIIVDKMKKDKKNTGTLISFSLPSTIGDADYDCEVPTQILLSSLEELSP